MLSETESRNPIVEDYCRMCGQTFKRHKDDPEVYCDEHRLEGVQL